MSDLARGLGEHRIEMNPRLPYTEIPRTRRYPVWSPQVRERAENEVAAMLFNPPGMKQFEKRLTPVDIWNA